MLPATAVAPPNPSLEPHSAMVPDADMLQAAQLLLPGDYRATGAFSQWVAKAICRPLQVRNTPYIAQVLATAAGLHEVNRSAVAFDAMYLTLN